MFAVVFKESCVIYHNTLLCATGNGSFGDAVMHGEFVNDNFRGHIRRLMMRTCLKKRCTRCRHSLVCTGVHGIRISLEDESFCCGCQACGLQRTDGSPHPSWTYERQTSRHTEHLFGQMKYRDRFTKHVMRYCLRTAFSPCHR